MSDSLTADKSDSSATLVVASGRLVGGRQTVRQSDTHGRGIPPGGRAARSLIFTFGVCLLLSACGGGKATPLAKAAPGGATANPSSAGVPASAPAGAASTHGSTPSTSVRVSPGSGR